MAKITPTQKTKNKPKKTSESDPHKKPQHIAKKSTTPTKKILATKKSIQKNKKSDANKKISAQQKIPEKQNTYVFKQHSIIVDTYKRNYQVLVPAVVRHEDKLSINVILGPADFSAEQLAYMIDAQRMGEIYGQIFAFPKGNWRQKKDQDVRYIEAMISNIQYRYTNQSRNVFVYAYSHGGEIAQRLYCETPQLISSFSFIAYSWQKTTCKPSMQPSVFITHSLQDTHYPFRGNEQYQSFQDTLTMITEHHEQLLIKKNVLHTHDYRCTRYTDISTSFELQYCIINKGGNTIPGSNYTYPPNYGTVFAKFDANAMAMQFFERHPHHQYLVIRDRGIAESY